MTSQPLERFLEIKTIIGEQVKNIKEAKILHYGKEQGKTIENYLDYNQDSKGTPISGFNRKSFYWWQWEVMRPDDKKYNRYLIPKKTSEK